MRNATILNNGSVIRVRREKSSDEESSSEEEDSSDEEESNDEDRDLEKLFCPLTDKNGAPFDSQGIYTVY